MCPSVSTNLLSRDAPTEPAPSASRVPASASPGPAAAAADRPRTLADVLAALPNLEGVASQRRHDLTSAVRRVVDLIGAPASDIPADAPALRMRLSLLTPTAAGMTLRRFRNVQSLFTAALSLTGAAVARNRSQHKLSPAWAALLASVPDRYQRARLSQFFGYASQENLDPEKVGDVDVDRFAERLGDNTLVERQPQVVRELCLTWNRCAESVAGWPAARLKVPDRRRTYALPVDAYPSSFRKDLEAYLKHRAGQDLFDETARQPARPSTLRDVRLRFLQMAAALVLSGRDPASIKTLADLSAPAAVKAALTYLWTRNGKRKTGQLQNLARTLLTVAQHWVKAPPEHIEALQAARRQVDPGPSGLTERNRARLRQFDDPDNLERLIYMPDAVLRALPKLGPLSYEQAVRFQSALAVAMLLVAPMRVKNLSSLRLERHIVRRRPGGPRHIVIPDDEVKNSVPLAYQVPERLDHLLEVYLTRCRPIFAADGDGHLFPARKGGAKSPAQLAAQIKRAIRKEAGVDLNAHAFRHLSAKLLLEETPGDYHTPSLVLGHKNFATTKRAYCGLERDDALRRLDALIDRRRAKERV